jgi:hypothetical protein
LVEAVRKAEPEVLVSFGSAQAGEEAPTSTKLIEVATRGAALALHREFLRSAQEASSSTVGLA